jgi:hypothetical protein
MKLNLKLILTINLVWAREFWFLASEQSLYFFYLEIFHPVTGTNFPLLGSALKTFTEFSPL